MHLNVESSRKHANDERLPTKFRNPELLKHTEQLISSASTVLSSSSTTWGGSEMEFPQSSGNGQPLGIGQRAAIEDWIPHLASTEEELPQTSHHRGNSATSDTFVGTDDFNLEEIQSTDSDSDDDYDIAKKCFEKAKKDFSSDQHAKALESFRAGLKRVEKLGLKKKARLELRTVQMRMGLSLLSLGELSESEQCLLSLAWPQTTDDKSKILALHASSGLAQIYLCKGSFDKAEDWCNKSRIGWKRIAGKQHPAYITCLKLSAFCSELNGNHAEAAAIEEIANESKAAPAPVDTGLDAYEPLGFTIEKSPILVTEYHMEIPDTTKKEASSRSTQFSPAKQPGSDPVNGPTAQTLAESPMQPKSGTSAVGSLHDAARKGDTGLIKRLLDNGADIEEAAGWDLERPLYLAAMHGTTSAVKCLLDGGANIEAKNRNSNTALSVAAYNGHTSTVECLLDYRANIKAKTDRGYTALLQAAHEGHIYIVKCLLNYGADIEAKTIHGLTALLQAAYNGHTSTVECLLDRGANIEAKNRISNTALTEAAYKGYISTVECLLDRGANIEAKNVYGHTALTRAAREGHIYIVKCLLDHGADIEAKTDRGHTALLQAASHGQRSTVECLLDRGARIKAANSLRETALLRACRLMNEEQNESEIVRTIELLCFRGADVSAKDYKGNSPLRYAREVKDSKIREELIGVLELYGAKK